MSVAAGRAAPVVFAVACAAMLAAWFAFDLFAAGAAAWWVTAGALLALATPVALLARGVRRRWARDVTVGVVATAVAVALLPWHPRKRFVAALHRVQPGMTVAEADAVMADYLPGTGAKWRTPDGSEPGGLSDDGRDGTLVYRWNDRDAAYDSDWGVVTIAAGRVVRVEFLPD